MTIRTRRHHPQVIRAKEMARAAGLDPECRDSRRSFVDAAFDEHFEREAVDNIYWDFYTADRWETPHRDGECSFSFVEQRLTDQAWLAIEDAKATARKEEQRKKRQAEVEELRKKWLAEAEERHGGDDGGRS